MPWFCAKDIRPARGTAENVVGDQAPWDEDKLAVEKDVHDEIEDLIG